MSHLNPSAERANSYLEPLVGVAVLVTIPLVFLEAEMGVVIAKLVNAAVWSVFTLRFLVVLVFCSGAHERRRWVGRSKLDLVIILVTFPALPASLASLRFLGMTNVLALFRLLQLGRLLVLGWFYRWLRDRFHDSPLVFTGAVAAISILIGANVLHLIEPKLTPSLTSALWFTFTTCSTVGYGDIVPETSGGRFVGVLLMVVGVATMAAFSGALASYLTSGRDRAAHHDLTEVIRELKEMKQQLARLEAIHSPSREEPGGPLPS